MKCSNDSLLTPVYLRLNEDMPWPEDNVFYMLTGSGLFLCRNNEHFRSCVPARNWPGELADQVKFIDLRFPRLPQDLLEQAVGFFEAVGLKHDAEAALLLVWDKGKGAHRLIVPRQRCTVYENWQGSRSPRGVHYDMPARVPRDWVIIGDIHSHVDFAAYSSATDQFDEAYRTGLHIVVGRIYDEPPQFHVEATVDGVRFQVEQDQVFEGYHKRRNTFPQKWFDWLKIDISSYYSYSAGNSNWKSSSGSAGGGGYNHTVHSPAASTWNGVAGYAVAPVDIDRRSGHGRKKKGGRNGARRGKRR